MLWKLKYDSGQYIKFGSEDAYSQGVFVLSVRSLHYDTLSRSLLDDFVHDLFFLHNVLVQCVSFTTKILFCRSAGLINDAVIVP